MHGPSLLRYSTASRKKSRNISGMYIIQFIIDRCREKKRFKIINYNCLVEVDE